MNVNDAGPLGFLADVWRAITLALGLNPDAASYVAVEPRSIAVVVAVALLAGASVLLGQSAVLFLNRVSRARFAISLALNAVIYVVNLAIWSTFIWGVSTFVFNATQPIGIGALALLLASAPFIFGFLVLVPYFGLIIVRILYVWSLLISIMLIQTIYAMPWLQAVITVGLGWILLLLVGRTIGRPVVALRDRVFLRVTGTQPYGPTSAPEGPLRTRRIGLRTQLALWRRRADELNVRDK
jgi:hypothetical protein